MTAVVDEPMLTTPAELPRAPLPPPRRARRRVVTARAKRRAMIVAGAIIGCWAALFVYDHLVGQLINDQRQMHLAAAANQPTIQPGAKLGVLQIPVVDLNEVVIEGVTVDHLRSGPAHLGGSALPGDAGVMVVYGHRSGYGGPFARLDELVAGSELFAQTTSGPAVRYEVREVLRGTSVGDLELADTDRLAYLVLVTSESGWLEDDQIVVVARSLPLGDVAALVPDLGAAPANTNPLGVNALQALAALFGAAVCVTFLRGRVRHAIVAVVAAPIVVFALIQIAMMADSVRPLTR